MNIPDDVPELAYRELRILLALLQEEERKRRQLLREIAAVHLWQQTRGRSQLARWISQVTVQRRDTELKRVEENITRLRSKYEELLSENSECAAYLPSPDEMAGHHDLIPKITLGRPTERPGH